MSFSKSVELLLKKKNPKLSSFIFEEKDKKEENIKKKKKDKDKDKDFEDELDSEDSDEGDSDSPEVSAQQVDNLISQLEVMSNTIDKTNKDDGTQSIESFIAGAVSGSVSESFKYSNMSIDRFVLSEDKKSLEDIEKDIDVLDRVLSKGTDLVDKFKKGKEVNVASYVTAAINAYKNFDNLFAKEKIIKQGAINVLILNSGAKAEANIKEFEELFHEELHRQFGVEYPEFALVTKKNNTAVGAMKQG